MTPSTFHVSETDFAGIAAMKLSDERSGAFAIVARRGATLLDWQVPHDGEMVPLTDGYRSPEDLASQHGVRNGIMAPFPNRIEDGRYQFDGRECDLLPGVPAGQREIMHGFLRYIDLLVTDIQVNPDGATVLFSGEIRPDAFPGYPFALKLDVRFDFAARSLALTVSATNVGDRPAPYAAGWHPYFRLGDGLIDRLELTVPAAHAIVTDARLLPLPGDAAFARLPAPPFPDFRHGRLIGNERMDLCYGGAEPEGDGFIRSHLRDPATGRRLTMWQPSGVTLIFTGDALKSRRRESVAIEPVEVMTNSFNRPDCAQAIRLSPGATRSFAFGVEFHTDDPGD